MIFFVAGGHTHARRLEDVVAHERFPGLAADLLDQLPGQHVQDVVIGIADAKAGGRPDVAQAAHRFGATERSTRLKLRMSELFAEQDEVAEPAVTARRSIGRIEDAMRVNTPNYDYYYLCPELRRKRMIPVLTRVRVKPIKAFGELVHHSGEEYIHVLEGGAEVHTEFYDPIVLETGESVYIDSNMGHAYIAAECCDEVLLLGVCSSSDEQLLESLMNLHGEETAQHKFVGEKPATAVTPGTGRRKPGALRKVAKR